MSGETSKIILASITESKSLSKYRESNKLLKSAKIKKNALIDFNKKYNYLDNDLNMNVFKSQFLNNFNYYFNIGKTKIYKDINSNINNNNTIKEDDSDDSDIFYYKQYKEFYEAVKKLIISKNNKSIDNPNQYIIKEIEKLISLKKEFSIKRRRSNKFDNNMLKISSFRYKCISDNNESNIGKSNIYLNEKEGKNKIILVTKTIDGRSKQKQLDIKQNKRYQLNKIFSKQNEKIKLNESFDFNKNNLINSVNIMPEILPPESMYKIFIYCIKQFDYEKKIYDKYINKEDFKILEQFARKLNDYIKKFYKLCKAKCQK